MKRGTGSSGAAVMMAAAALIAGCSAQPGLAPRGVALAQPAPPPPLGYAFAQAAGGVQVSRPADPLSYSDGLAAKQAALAHCAGQGQMLNPAAFGRYQAGAWLFAKGCL